MINTKPDRFEITVADNGFIVDFHKYENEFDWDAAKIVCMSLEEVFRLIQQELNNNG
jgi:hypothetical protein